MGHTCDDCGETFPTLTKLRLHEKDDCPARDTYAQFSNPGEDDTAQVAGSLLTCQDCGHVNENANFEETVDYDGDDYHLIVEYDCRRCGFENENRAVMTGVDESDLSNLPPHLRPE